MGRESFSAHDEPLEEPLLPKTTPDPLRQLSAGAFGWALNEKR
jgi:hypothetical protein